MALDFASDFTFFATSFAALMAIIDPVGAVPIFLAMTRSRSAEETRRIVRVATATAGTALLTFALCGTAILDFFGISVPAFRASGGILMLIMAIAMIHGSPRRAKHTPEEDAEALEKESIAVVPLAIPLLVGPGTLSTVVLLGDKAKQSFDMYAMLLLAIAAVVAATWTCLRLSEYVRKALGESGIRIASRIMGLLLAALAVQFIADGAVELFPGLGG